MADALLDGALDTAIIGIDVQGRITSWSAGAQRLLGWTALQAVGQSYDGQYTDEDRAAGVMQAEWQAALQRGQVRSERWHRRADGSPIWVNAELVCQRDARGCAQGFVEVLRDRTAPHLAAEQHRADAEFLRSVLAASGDCIKVLDLDGRLNFMSEGALRLMEVNDFGSVRGCPWPDFWEGAGNVAACQALDAARAGRLGHFQGTAPTLKGRLRCWDVQVTPILDAAGQPERLLVVSRDITEQREVQLRLQASEERLSRALGASEMVGIWDCDLQAGTVFGDANFARFNNIDPALADAGAPLERIFAHLHPDDLVPFRNQIERLMEGADEFAIEHRLAKPDGSWRWVLAKGRLVRDAHGLPARLPGAVVDVTERRQAEERQRLLTDELAHRVKNTLAVVQSIARQTLRGDGAVAAGREAFTARLMALSTAHDVLTRGQWSDASLHALVDAAARLHTDGADGRFRIAGPEVVLSARAALCFAMVLHELGTNAAKYGALSGLGGVVDIGWTLAAGAGGQHLHFSWTETGGPAVPPPAHRGFGTRLIERSLVSEFGAEVALSYDPAGVRLKLDVRLAAVQQS